MNNAIKNYFTLIEIPIGDLNIKQHNFYSGKLLGHKKSFEDLTTSNKEEIKLMLLKINQINFLEYLIYSENNVGNPTFIGSGYYIDKSADACCFLILYYQNRKEIFEIEFSKKIFEHFKNGMLDDDIIYARNRAVFVSQTEIV